MITFTSDSSVSEINSCWLEMTTKRSCLPLSKLRVNYIKLKDYVNKLKQEISHPYDCKMYMLTNVQTVTKVHI